MGVRAPKDIVKISRLSEFLPALKLMKEDTTVFIKRRKEKGKCVWRIKASSFVCALVLCGQISLGTLTSSFNDIWFLDILFVWSLRFCSMLSTFAFPILDMYYKI